MDYNYHTHTYHCHHASGTPEEYILRAIDGGVRYMGFSEHIPLVLSDGRQSRYRMYIDDLTLYAEEISALRKKYSGKIDIRLGFECEYYPEYFDKMLECARSVGADYMILGQHFNAPEDSPVSSYVVNPSDSHRRLEGFCSSVISGIKSGFFTYACHPDCICFTGDDAVYEENMRKVCEAARECRIPLEINFLGIRKNKNYPNEKFWRIVGEVGAPVTFGFDAHTVEDACDEASLVRALELVKKYNLNYIGRPTLRSIL